MAIRTTMSADEIMRVLAQINAAADEANNGKVIYIRDGALAFEDGGTLFDVAVLA